MARLHRMPKITPHLKVGGVSGYHSNNTYVMENARHSRIAGCSNLPEGEMYHVKNSLFHITSVHIELQSPLTFHPIF